MKKICVVITTRGNYAKTKTLIRYLKADPEVELQLIFGGGAVLPKYGDVSKSIIEVPDCTIHFLLEGETLSTMAKSAGVALIEFTTAFERLKPDVVVLVGDRFEMLAIATSALYLNIPIAHIEGGETTGSVDDKIRNAVTQMATWHFSATEGATYKIIACGIPAPYIWRVGATSLDVIAEIDTDNLDPIMEAQKESGLGVTVDVYKPYLLVSQHPVTTEYEDNYTNIGYTIRALQMAPYSDLNMPLVWIWPNMDGGSDGITKGIREFRESGNVDNVHFFRGLPIELFAPLLNNAACIVGNSSAGIRESSFLGTPCVNIGTRQSGRERASNVVDCGHSVNEIREAVRFQMDHGKYAPSYLYGDGHAGKRIAEVLSCG